MLNRRFALAATLATLLGTTPLIAQANSATLGQPAPAFTVQAADGKPVSLASFKGKTVVLEWTNHDCPFVRKHYESGNMPALQKEAAAKGIVWLQVISSAPGQQGHVDGPGAIKLNRERAATPTATLLDADGKVGRLYDAKTTPHLYIVNAQGVLVYKGGIDSIPSSNKEDIAKAENYVRAALDDLAAGRAVAKPTTRPYGCSVKYGSGA